MVGIIGNILNIFSLKHMKLAGHTVDELLEIYRSDLFDYFLPFLDRYVYDEIHGGFMCHTDRKGKKASTNKRTWYDGRGVWVYSWLYHHFGEQKEFLKRAQQTIDFLMEIESGEYPYWPWGYNREGITLKDQKPDIYGSLFVAEGLAGLAAVTGKSQYWQKSKSILMKCVAEYDRKSYEYIPHYATSGSRLQAPRVLGHWMILLNLSAHLLELQDDPKIRQISDRCIEAILEHHLHPEFNLLIEYLNHDFSLPDEPIDQFSYTGHGIETLWMLMKEGLRRENDSLYHTAENLFKRHVEVSWDRVYGGFFHELTNVKESRWLTDKVLWAQEEVLIGLMVMIEKNKEPWAVSWFNKVYPYVRVHFILHDHPDRLWVNGGDRQMEVHHQVDRFENYHHPRHLMMNIRALEKLVTDGGKNAMS